MSAAGMNNIHLSTSQQNEIQSLVKEKASANGRFRSNIKALDANQRAYVVLAFTGAIPKGFELTGEPKEIIKSIKATLDKAAENPGLKRKKSLDSLRKAAGDLSQKILGTQGRLKVSDVQVAINAAKLDKPEESAITFKDLMATDGLSQKIINSNHQVIIGLVSKIGDQNSEKLCKTLVTILTDSEINQLTKLMPDGQLKENLKIDAGSSPEQKEAFAKGAIIDLANKDPEVCSKLLKAMSPEQKEAFAKGAIIELANKDPEVSSKLLKALYDITPQDKKEFTKEIVLEVFKNSPADATKLAKALVGPQIASDVSSGAQPMRGNDLGSRFVSALVNKLIGSELDKDLQTLATSVSKTDNLSEMKKSGDVEQKNQSGSQMESHTTNLLNNIINIIENKKDLKELCSFIGKEVEKGQEKSNLTLDPEGVALSIIFLRVVQPKITEYSTKSTEEFKKNMTALSDIVQSLTVRKNHKVFGEFKGSKDQMDNIRKILFSSDNTNPPAESVAAQSPSSTTTPPIAPARAQSLKDSGSNSLNSTGVIEEKAEITIEERIDKNLNAFEKFQSHISNSSSIKQEELELKRLESLTQEKFIKIYSDDQLIKILGFLENRTNRLGSESKEKETIMSEARTAVIDEMLIRHGSSEKKSAEEPKNIPKTFTQQEQDQASKITKDTEKDAISRENRSPPYVKKLNKKKIG